MRLENVILGQLRIQNWRTSNDIVGSSWEHLRDILGTSYRHLGNILGTSRGHLGGYLGDFLRTSCGHLTDMSGTSFVEKYLQSFSGNFCHGKKIPSVLEFFLFLKLDYRGKPHVNS